MPEEIKQALNQLENEQLQVKAIFKKITDEEENELIAIKHQLAQLNEKKQRWQQDSRLTQLLNEEEAVLIERFNHQHQFLEEIAEKRTNYRKQVYQTENDLQDQLAQKQLTDHEEDDDGLTR